MRLGTEANRGLVCPTCVDTTTPKGYRAGACRGRAVPGGRQPRQRDGPAGGTGRSACRRPGRVGAAPADAPQVDAFAQVVQITKMCRGVLAGAMLLVLAFVLRYVLLTATRGSPVLQRIVGRSGRAVLLGGCVHRC